MPTAHAATAPGSTRARVVRGASEGGPWEMWSRTPPPQLRGLVLELWAGLSSEPHARHRVMPNGEVMLMLHLETPQRLTERHGASACEFLRAGFIAGLQERPATFECLAAGTRVVSVRFTPLGAWMFLRGMPQTELTHRVVCLEDILPAREGISELRERMLDAANLGVALELLEHWLLQRWVSASPSHAAMHTANAMLRGGHAALSVSQIARACGMSTRRMHELCLREMGLPAKRLQRVLRFRRAVEQVAERPHHALREVALACGYYDQPHLYRDFRALTGMTPVEYRVALGDGADGPDVIGG